jgi:uncharacterized lipoprotein YbaY
MKQLTISLLLILILAACAPSQATSSPPTPQPTIVLTKEVTVPSGNDTNSSADLTRSDEQGMVMFEVTPLDLTAAAATLDFNIAMNTHSVDLSMDLATLATLTTDTGVMIQAEKWDAVPGGHHVNGKLIFPSTKDGKSILDGASTLTLTIVNVDAPSRVFEWQLN